MNDIAFCSVATGAHYIRGQSRLRASMRRWAPEAFEFAWTDKLPEGCPPHRASPYAFKSYALMYAKQAGFKRLLWADSCIVALSPLDRIWEHAEEYGAWIGDNGFSSATWTADSAYPILFPGIEIEAAREINRKIPHVVATAFAVDLSHPVGGALLSEYHRLGQEGAFLGPWSNTPKTPCGPPECRGHRHDQAALSVLADRYLIPLTQSPDIFAYYGGETDQTILSADGGHARAI